MLVSFAVGLLTCHRFNLKAFSLEQVEQWHFIQKETKFAIRINELLAAHSGWTVPELNRSSLFHKSLNHMQGLVTVNVPGF